MGLHTNTVFKNSCLKVPLNPSSRLPSAKYERISLKLSSNRPKKRDSISSDIENDETKNQISFREFYKSIPDYKDVTHLSNQEFYLKLECLRENKNELLLKCGKPIQEKWSQDQEFEAKSGFIDRQCTPARPSTSKQEKSDFNDHLRRNSSSKAHSSVTEYRGYYGKDNSALHHTDSFNFKLSNEDLDNKYLNPRYHIELNHGESKIGHGKHSGFSGIWDDENKNAYAYRDDTNIPFQKYRKVEDTLSKKSFSVPTSPVKKSPKYNLSNNITSSRRFKMTERDEEKQMLDQLRDYSKELEYKVLQNKTENKQFRANPVPIESRIPLFDKIMEDQELRRSISKLQSTAELQAQMRPFKFTEREEHGLRGGLSNFRLCRSNPQLNMPLPPPDATRNSHFKAKPVPKNLFSNYIYEKMREDDFYRALNRRIRAEEMLKAASLPPSMAKREKRSQEYCNSPSLSRKMDQRSDTISSETSTSDKSKRKKKKKRGGSSRQNKINREYENLKHEFVSSEGIGSPTKRNRNFTGDLLKKLYGSQGSNQTPSYTNRSRSALEVPSVNRSNLAAVLRIESTKKKMEADVIKIMEEERFQTEVRWRDSVLRRKPAWNTLKYSHSGDLAMRLQTRKDEERLLQEQFLHEMELMYGRVHRQPLMFERTYGPRRSGSSRETNYFQEDNKRPAKPRSALVNRELTPNTASPNRSRKVSINETAETIRNEIDDLFDKNSDDEKDSKSSDGVPESIDNGYDIEEDEQ